MSATGARRFSHPLTLLGAIATTVSAVLFLVFALLEVIGVHTSPYWGIVTFLALPAVFLVGLALMPLGARLARRRAASGEAAWPVLDLNTAPARRTLAVIAC